MNQTPEECGYFCSATFCWCSSLLFIFLQCSFWQEVGTLCHSVFLQQHGNNMSQNPTNIMLCLKINIKPHLLHGLLHAVHPLFIVWTLFLNMQLQTWCYYLDTPRQCQVPLALPAPVTALPRIIPLWVHLSHWWWAPSGDRNYTFGLWILSLTHSLEIIQVEYSWFSLFVVVMFYRVACDTEWVMLNHWTERKYTIRFMFIFGLNTCTTHSIHNLVVWFCVNFHVKTPYLIVVVVQLLSHVRVFETSWTAAPQTSLSFAIFQSLLNLCSLSLWCHPTISSSVAPFSPCLQSFQHEGLLQ